MIKLLRTVEFSGDLRTAGPVIKASLIGHVFTYDDLVREGRKKAQDIIDQANLEAETIRRNARDEMAAQMRSDLELIRKSTAQLEQDMMGRAASLCQDICVTVLEKFMDQTTDVFKIKVLVESLLTKTQISRELSLSVHPEQQDLVRSCLADKLAAQFNIRIWSVHPDPDLDLFHLRVMTPNGAEINVSLENLIAVYREELEGVAPLIEPLVTCEGPHDEN